jgi:hypothetical protein
MSTDYRAELQRLVKAYDEHGGRWPDEDVQALHNAVKAARAALAQPEPEGLSDQDLDDLANEMLDWNCEGWRAYARAVIAADRTRYARPTIEPVPVAERPWEREKGWRDLDGECWWCPPDGPPYWQMANPAMVYGGWLLPPHALPLPTPTP